MFHFLHCFQTVQTDEPRVNENNNNQANAQKKLNIEQKQSENFEIMKMNFKRLNHRKIYNKMFFREFDVWHHIEPNDFWVILNRRVFDLSHLVKLVNELPSNSNDLTVSFCAFVLCSLID